MDTLKTMVLDTDKRQLTKFCTACEKFLDLEKFCWLPSVNKYHNYCRECDKKHKREWYLKNKLRVDEERKKWQLDNYEKHLEHMKKYRNTDNAKAIKNEWSRKNREKKNDRDK